MLLHPPACLSAQKTQKWLQKELAGVLFRMCPLALFAVCCVSTVVKWKLFVSPGVFYRTCHYDLGGLQTSIRFFPEQPCETEEEETRGKAL